MPKPDEWLMGYACALANISRLHNETQLVRHVLLADGITIQRLEHAGVEPYDLLEIKHCVYGRSHKFMERDLASDKERHLQYLQRKRSKKEK